MNAILAQDRDKVQDADAHQWLVPAEGLLQEAKDAAKRHHLPTRSEDSYEEQNICRRPSQPCCGGCLGDRILLHPQRAMPEAV